MWKTIHFITVHPLLKKSLKMVINLWFRTLDKFNSTREVRMDRLILYISLDLISLS